MGLGASEFNGEGQSDNHSYVGSLVLPAFVQAALFHQVLHLDVHPMVRRKACPIVKIMWLTLE